MLGSWVLLHIRDRMVSLFDAVKPYFTAWIQLRCRLDVQQGFANRTSLHFACIVAVASGIIERARGGRAGTEGWS